MAATITPPNRKLLDRLLRSGRFNNYSEIVRYGLELVRREIEREDLSPYPDSALAKAYQRSTQEERDLDTKLGRACALPSARELE